MQKATLNEVEPCKKDQKVRVNVGQISTMIDWPHELPTKAK
jgi:hypothetical protein